MWTAKNNENFNVLKTVNHLSLYQQKKGKIIYGTLIVENYLALQVSDLEQGGPTMAHGSNPTCSLFPHVLWDKIGFHILKGH